MNINYEEIHKQLDLLKSREELEKMRLDNEEVRARIIENSEKNQVEIAKMRVDIAKIGVDIDKMRADTDKTRKETKYYPLMMIITASLTAIAIALINKLL